LENTEENSEIIWKLWKKIVKNLENTEENSEKIGKIQKKIVKRYGKYGRK
jgi:DNA anti-recombination protein RmuC